MDIQLSRATYIVLDGFKNLQGLFSRNKISGVGSDFGQLVHVLTGPNKQRALKPGMILS